MLLLLALVTIAAVADSVSVTGTNGEDVSLQSLLERIELMESRHAGEIQKLRVKHEEDIQRLTARVENCERATVSVLDKVSSTEEVKDEATDSSEDTTNQPGQEESHGVTSVSGRNVRQGNKIRTPMKRLYEGNNIAFSAYLDHDLNGVGTDQIIAMNQVLLNDGNGYSKHTGVFTAPIDGVYSFSFFIADRNVNQIFVRLTVNGTPEVDAIADTLHTHHDAQGGNTVNLKLYSGDAVMLRHSRTIYADTDHVEANANSRFSTFSGFLLYPIDNAPTIVAEHNTNQIFVRLTMNSTPAVDAIADAFHSYHDAQGGNAVNLKLSSGDAVMLRHSRTGYVDTDHLEGSVNGRFSTFSGFLLYPTDNAPIVGK